MTTADDVIRVASNEVGYHESGNNNNKFGQWYGMNNVAWCYIFCQWVFDHAGHKLPFRTAYVPAGADWARQHGVWRPSTQCQRGDLILFDWSGSERVQGSHTHIGIVESRGSDNIIHTIEGNSSNQVRRRQWVAGNSQIGGTINCQGLFNGQSPPGGNDDRQPNQGETGNRFMQFASIKRGSHDIGTSGSFPDIKHPVQTLQNALNIVLRHESGPGRLTPDGAYGPVTEKVVHDLQAFAHTHNDKIAVDGQVGPQTWAVLDFFLDEMGR